MKMKYGILLLAFILIFSIGMDQHKASAAFYKEGDRYWTNECWQYYNPAVHPYGVPQIMWCTKTYGGVYVGGYVSLVPGGNEVYGGYYYQGYLYPLDGGPIIAPTKVEELEKE